MKKTDNRTNKLRIRVQSFMLYKSWALPVVRQAQILRKVFISFSRWPDSLLLPCSYTSALYFAGYHSQYNVTCAVASQNIYTLHPWVTMFDIWTIVYWVSFFEKSGSCLQNCISNSKYSHLLILLVYSIKYIRRHYLSATGWHNINMILVVWKICGSY